MLTSIHQPIKIAIIGAGRVGASSAYALQLSGLASEIVLINAHHERAEGEAEGEGKTREGPPVPQ